MPIGRVILPENINELNSKLSDAKQEKEVISAIYDHLGEKGTLAGWEQSPNGMRDIDLKMRKCIIYLIRGKFEVGSADGNWTAQDSSDKGYEVEAESTLRLHRHAIVVIIYT